MKKSEEKVEVVYNFQDYIFQILKRFTGKELNLMISGGSFLDTLNYSKYKELSTKLWNIFYADERCNDKYLNYDGSTPFLSYLDATVYPINIKLNPEQSALDYEKTLLKFKQIDVCFLGIGENGHICSLWPNSNDLLSEKYVTNVIVDCPLSKNRITITLKYINHKIKELYFVIPPKDGKMKNIKEPHSSIKSKITKDYTTILFKGETN